MSRSALAVLLLLGTAGCGMQDSPPPPPTSGRLVLLALIGLAVIVVACVVTLRHAADGPRRPRRALFFVAALSITLTGALFAIVGDSRDSLTSRLLPSAAALAWGSFLYLRFRCALDERRSFPVARLGALLAVVQVPIWWTAIWVETDGVDVWRVAGSLAILAGAAAHATYLLLTSVDAGRRWLVRLLLGADVGFVAIVLCQSWFRGPQGDAVTALLRLLSLTILTGTALVEVRRLDETGNVRRAAPPDPDGARGPESAPVPIPDRS